jgi:hypothetical protein
MDSFHHCSEPFGSLRMPWFFVFLTIWMGDK